MAIQRILDNVTCHEILIFIFSLFLYLNHICKCEYRAGEGMERKKL